MRQPPSDIFTRRVCLQLDGTDADVASFVHPAPFRLLGAHVGSRSGSLATRASSTLIAKSRFSLVSLVRYTSPMPPAPIAVTIWYGPRQVPGERANQGGLHGRRQRVAIQSTLAQRGSPFRAPLAFQFKISVIGGAGRSSVLETRKR